MSQERYEAVTGLILGAAVEVHRVLGSGLLESAYRTCLLHELSLRGVARVGEMQIDVVYKGIVAATGYRVDLLVADCVVVEIKAVEKVLAVH